MNFLFGPVNSRRLGRSLGIDLLPGKICNFDCIYCEVGPTTKLTCRRLEYVPTADIIAEIDAYLESRERCDRVDVFTITAGGEPTLHLGIGRIIDHLGKRTGKPVVVLTNGTTFHLPEVRRDLAAVDIVIPSLDTVVPASVRKLNRPAGCFNLQESVEGLVLFSREFSGRLWLEVLIAAGINDTAAEMKALAAVISRMKVERVQLNTVVRPPLLAHARPVSKNRLEELAALLEGQGCPPVEVIADVKDEDDGKMRGSTEVPPRDDGFIRDEILTMLKRRPCTRGDIRKTLGPEAKDGLEGIIEELMKTKQIKKERHGDRQFYRLA